MIKQFQLQAIHSNRGRQQGTLLLAAACIPGTTTGQALRAGAEGMTGREALAAVVGEWAG